MSEMIICTENRITEVIQDDALFEYPKTPLFSIQLTDLETGKKMWYYLEELEWPEENYENTTTLVYKHGELDVFEDFKTVGEAIDNWRNN